MKDVKDFPFNVYNPEPEAKELLEKHSPLTVACGLLNQLTACRQTKAIGAESRAELIADLEKENLELRSMVKDLIWEAQKFVNIAIWHGSRRRSVEVINRAKELIISK